MASKHSKNKSRDNGSRGRGRSGPSTKGRPPGVASIRKASFSSARLLRRSLRAERPSSLGRNLRKPLEPPSRDSSLAHHSFKRSYREDYKRELDVPDIRRHVLATFRMIFRNWRVFLPLLIVTAIVSAVLVGVMSESTYSGMRSILDQASIIETGEEMNKAQMAGVLFISTLMSGGLAGAYGEATMVFVMMIFLFVWLMTIYLLRHSFAGRKVKFRDALYNSMTPLISNLVILIVAVIDAVPLLVLTIAYSAAVQTDFFSTPFYTLLFFGFAALMITISGYLLSSTLMALVAVSAPGLYPTKALNTASDLMRGRRVRFVVRLVALVIVLLLMWVVVMLPIIVFDLFMKQFEWTAAIPFVPICAVILTAFSEIYVSAYIYMYYRWMIKA